VATLHRFANDGFRPEADLQGKLSPSFRSQLLFRFSTRIESLTRYIYAPREGPRIQGRERSVRTKVGYFLGAVLSLSAALIAPAQAAEPVVVVVKVFPTPGREEELNARYLKQLEFLKQAEPRSSFRLHRSASPNEPTSFLWYEVYESREALDHHLKVVMPDFQKAFGPTPKGLIARPSEHANYRQIGN